MSEVRDSDNGGRAEAAAISRDGNWIMKYRNDLYDFYDFYNLNGLNGLNDFNELTNSLINCRQARLLL